MSDFTPPKKEENSIDKVILAKIVASVKWWHQLASLNEKDPFLITVFKIVLRLIGIVVLILMSPLALIGLIIGIIFVL